MDSGLIFVRILVDIHTRARSHIYIHTRYASKYCKLHPSLTNSDACTTLGIRGRCSAKVIGSFEPNNFDSNTVYKLKSSLNEYKSEFCGL